MFEKQAQRLRINSHHEAQGNRRAFMDLYTQSVIAHTVPRDRAAQARFRDDLIRLYDPYREEPESSMESWSLTRGVWLDAANFKDQLVKKYDAVREDEIHLTELWCPIPGMWLEVSSCRAAHIFPRRLGQALMDHIFGAQDEPELYSPYNGILMSEIAEKLFDKGAFVIVPKVSDNPTEVEIREWHNSQPKRYVIRIVDHDDPRMRRRFGFPDPRSWIDLDGEEVQFRTEHRPRARYLYWHYCHTVLRHSWHRDQLDEALDKQLGKPLWATPGPYLRKALLLAFVEEMGHDGNDLLQGATTEEAGCEVSESDPTALAAATQTILSSTADEDDSSDSDEDSE